MKALRAKNYFPISAERVNPAHVYVFVLLNRPGQPVQYFIVPGSALVEAGDRFGKWFRDPKFPGIHPRDLHEFENNWKLFESTPHER